jgi:hypothetical protein
MMRTSSLAACLLAAVVGTAALPAAAACLPGSENCPVVLKMAPGAVSISAYGFVSAQQPNFYFQFAARAGQMMTVETVGGGLKTGPGIPISGPGGFQDAVDVDTPYRLPVNGSYTLTLHANTMSDGPFGRFRLTLTIR